MILSAHQPNFVPYYPFFQKMEQSDVFVILTQCQFEKNKYQNRFRSHDRWHTMSVNKGMEPIHLKKYVNHDYDWRKILKSYPRLRIFSNFITPNMAMTNFRIIQHAAALLNIRTKIILDEPTYKKGTERIIELCYRAGANTYLSGISGRKYLDLQKLQDAGIRVIFQDESEMSHKPLVEVI